MTRQSVASPSEARASPSEARASSDSVLSVLFFSSLLITLFSVSSYFSRAVSSLTVPMTVSLSFISVVSSGELISVIGDSWSFLYFSWTSGFSSFPDSLPESSPLIFCDSLGINIVSSLPSSYVNAALPLAVFPRISVTLRRMLYCPSFRSSIFIFPRTVSYLSSTSSEIKI